MDQGNSMQLRTPMEERTIADREELGRTLNTRKAYGSQIIPTIEEDLQAGIAEVRRKSRLNAPRRTSFVGMSPEQLQDHIQEMQQEETKAMTRITKIQPDNHPSYILHPHGTFRLRWDLASICFIFYNALFIPFQVAFTKQSHVNTYWEEPFDRFIDLFFILDLGINFFTGIEKDGRVIYNHKTITFAYIRGWFLIDLASAFPFAAILSNDSNTNNVYRANQLGKLLKMFRLIRLFRMFRILRILNRLEYALLIRSAISSILKFVLIVTFSSHWFSCFFYGISPSGENSWVYQTMKPNATIFDRYIASLYWSIMTMTTVGFGDVSAKNSVERLFSIVAMIIGAGIFAYGITNVVSLVANLTAEETEFRHKMDEVNEYMEARELPIELRGEIREFVHQARKSKETKLAVEHEILSELTSMLRSKIALSINDHFLKKMPFFVGSDPNFIMEISLSMRMICFSPHEHVVEEGEEGHEMFFIFRGAVQVLKKGKPVIALGENQYFGEMAILNEDCIRLATVQTLCFCELRMLSREKFLEAVAHFPAMKDRIANFAQVRTEALHRRVSIKEETDADILGELIEDDQGDIEDTSPTIANRMSARSIPTRRTSQDSHQRNTVDGALYRALYNLNLCQQRTLSKLDSLEAEMEIKKESTKVVNL